jgi:precorrin-3B C17-methyltransferase
VAVSPLAEADPARADMATCVIVGTADTRLVPRPGLAPLVYTPRRAGA